MPKDINQSKIKEAFSRVKTDIFSLQSDIFSLAREISELKRTLIQTDKPTDNQTKKITSVNTISQQTQTPTNTLSTQTNAEEKQTPSSFQQTISEITPQTQPLKTSNLQVSTGNRGVPTDRQTNQQTDTQSIKFVQYTKPHIPKAEDKITQIANVSEIISSLDTLKKDLRAAFKKLTPQEMLVYSTIYQLSDEGFIVDYPLLASKTSLTESSIRDYVLKLTKKAVPLDKSKENNKRIILSIPQDFKKIAPLSTLISLRKL